LLMGYGLNDFECIWNRFKEGMVYMLGANNSIKFNGLKLGAGIHSIERAIE